MVAAAIFSAGGLDDLAWHQVFGVESGLDALVSPMHLLLLLGGLLGVTDPLREGNSEKPQRLGTFPLLGSVTLATALSAFFLLYVSPFTTDAPLLPLTAIPEGTVGHEQAEAPAVVGLAAYLLTTVIVVLPVLWLLVHRRLPAGGITLLVTAVATLSAAVAEFEQPVVPVAAAAAGVAADLTMHLVRRMPTTSRLLLVGAGIPVLLWSAHLTALHLTAGLRWPPELIMGVPILSAMLGTALCLLGAQQAPDRTTPPGLSVPIPGPSSPYYLT